MQIDGFAPHLVPRSKRVVTQNQHLTVELKLGVVLNACPAFGAERARPIIVADDEVLRAIES